MSYIYVKPGIAKKAIIDFLVNQRTKSNTEIHAFSVIRNGELLCRIAVPPYSVDDNKQLFSLSKSFCSTAVGFAIDEGLFKLSDRIVDMFPEDVPENASENLCKMTVHNVLSMSTGHANCVMGIMKDAENPVKAFFSKELAYVPGEKFVYNTGATLLLSIIVQKYTGKTVYNYLYEKYFKYLACAPEKWDIIPSGYCEGGVGMYATIKDIENLGMLYMNNGMINGKQILSKEWIKLATSKQIDNNDNGTPDWCSGYGYQFWKNSREGQRGDGAFGQLCFMLPSTKTLISVQGECRSDMQKEVDEVYTLAEQIEQIDNSISDQEFKEFIDNFYAPNDFIQGDISFDNKRYIIDENSMGIKYIDFTKENKTVIMRLFKEGDYGSIVGSFGEYNYNELYITNFKPTLTGLSPSRYEKCSFACTIAEASENSLLYHYRFKNAPQSGKIAINVSNGTISVEFLPRTGNMRDGAQILKGSEI